MTIKKFKCYPDIEVEGGYFQKVNRPQCPFTLKDNEIYIKKKKKKKVIKSSIWSFIFNFFFSLEHYLSIYIIYTPISTTFSFCLTFFFLLLFYLHLVIWVHLIFISKPPFFVLKLFKWFAYNYSNYMTFIRNFLNRCL